MTINTKNDNEIKELQEADEALRKRIKALQKELDVFGKKITALSKDKWANFDFDALNLREDAAALEEIVMASFSTDSARDALDKFIDSFGERFKRDGYYQKPLALAVRFSLTRDEAITDELVETFSQLAKSIANGRKEVILNIFEHGLSDNGIFRLILSGENFEHARIDRAYYGTASTLFDGSLHGSLEKIAEKLWYDRAHPSEWIDFAGF